MQSKVLYVFTADAILFGHFLFIAFVIAGLLLICAGKFRAWPWIRNPWFRLTHLIAIGVVVVQSWLGAICPLTTWEMVLREKAGEAVYSGSFMAHWLGRLIYYQAPEWVFILCYTVFGALVAATWFWVRPRSFARS